MVILNEQFICTHVCNKIHVVFYCIVCLHTSSMSQSFIDQTWTHSPKPDQRPSLDLFFADHGVATLLAEVMQLCQRLAEHIEYSPRTDSSSSLELEGS